VRALIQGKPHIHLVEPVPLGGEIGYYSGEDMPEKASMMAYADVFVTVYSTMVVETAIQDRPIVSACIDIPGGWNQPNKFSLSLREISNWPTHLRFREANAGRVAYDREQLLQAINFYLEHPDADSQQRGDFIERECTYTDGSAGQRSAQFLLSLLDQQVR
jgi:CDP-glycerol glycerophosphotransferase (TagB/SpsB family)